MGKLVKLIDTRHILAASLLSVRGKHFQDVNCRRAEAARAQLRRRSPEVCTFVSAVLYLSR